MVSSSNLFDRSTRKRIIYSLGEQPTYLLNSLIRCGLLNPDNCDNCSRVIFLSYELCIYFSRSVMNSGAASRVFVKNLELISMIESSSSIFDEITRSLNGSIVS